MIFISTTKQSLTVKHCYSCIYNALVLEMLYNYQTGCQLSSIYLPVNLSIFYNKKQLLPEILFWFQENDFAISCGDNCNSVDFVWMTCPLVCGNRINAAIFDYISHHQVLAHG